MDAAAAGVITTGLLGIVGIGGTFLAPSWSQGEMEERRERKNLRRAARLVEHELGLLSGRLDISDFSDGELGDHAEWLASRLTTTAWSAEQVTLAEALPYEIWIGASRQYQIVVNLQEMLRHIGDHPDVVLTESQREQFAAAAADSEGLRKRFASLKVMQP